MTICCYTEINHRWSEQELAEKLAVLPGNLQQQALRKHQWIDGQLSVAGKLLLLKVLEGFGNGPALSELKYSTYHRPYFDGGIDFNIAHSGNIAICCGTNDGRIGIDIEQVKEIDLGDYTDYFTPDEWEKINNSPSKYDGFYDLWTRKEAVLKAIGTGFNTALSSVDVSAESLVYDSITYHLNPLAINKDYKCSLAATRGFTDIQLMPVNF